MLAVTALIILIYSTYFLHIGKDFDIFHSEKATLTNMKYAIDSMYTDFEGSDYN